MKKILFLILSVSLFSFFGCATSPKKNLSSNPSNNSGSTPSVNEALSFFNTNGAPGNYFGSSVAISGDESTIAIAAKGTKDGSLDNVGKVYVYTNTGNNYTLAGILSITDNNITLDNNNPLSSLDITYNGSTIVLGTSHPFPSGKGTVYVYNANNEKWADKAENAILQPTDLSDDDGFGANVSISSNGNVLVCGTSGIASSTISGWAYVFTNNSASGYVQMQKIASPITQSQAYFGFGLKISPDASTIIIGAPGATNLTDGSCGRVWIYTNTGDTNYSLVQNIIEKYGVSSFGYSIATSYDAKYIAITAADADGYVDIYTKNGSQWSEKIKIDYPNIEDIGYGVEMNYDGSIIGVYADYNVDKGSVLVISNDNLIKTYVSSDSGVDGFGETTFAGTINQHVFDFDAMGKVCVAGAPLQDIETNSSQGKACLFK